MSFRATKDEGEISKVVRRAGRWSVPLHRPLPLDRGRSLFVQDLML